MYLYVSSGVLSGSIQNQFGARDTKNVISVSALVLKYRVMETYVGL